MSKIAIDIDNTICNTSEFFGKLSEQYDKEILHKNSYIDYNKAVPRSQEWTKEELDYYIKNIFNKESINIPIKEEAIIYINKLKEQGFKIIFITNRGTREDDHSDLIVEEYLDKHNIPHDNIITKSNDKYKYLNDCEFFIDDSIKNCEEALEYSNCKVIMMMTNITKEYNNKKLYKTNNWKDIYNYIMKNR